MKKILWLFTINCSLYGCGIFGPTKGSNDTSKPAPLPPNKIYNENMAMKVDTSQPTTIEKNKRDNHSQIKPRIQEKRSIGGTVEQIKINNNHLPDYYVYPPTQQHLNNDNQPNKNITTPSWQINW